MKAETLQLHPGPTAAPFTIAKEQKTTYMLARWIKALKHRMHRHWDTIQPYYKNSYHKRHTRRCEGLICCGFTYKEVSTAIQWNKTTQTARRTRVHTNLWRLPAEEVRQEISRVLTFEQGSALAMGSFQLYLTLLGPCVCRVTLLFSSETGPCCTAQAGLKVLAAASFLLQPPQQLHPHSATGLQELFFVFLFF